MGATVRPVRTHDIVQTGAGSLEPAAGLGVIVAVDQAHEFGHGVAVVPWRAEGVFLDQPAGREDDEVGDCGAGVVGWGG